MAIFNLSNKILGAILGVSLIVIIIINLMISSAVSDSAIESVEDNLKRLAKEQAASALSTEIVKEEFIDYIVDNVKKKAVPELKNSMSNAAGEIIRPITQSVVTATETLKGDVALLKSRTDVIEFEKMAKLEKMGEEIEKTFSKSTKSIDKFINLRLTDLVPPGTVSAFFCNPNKPPEGWLICNGETITNTPEFKADQKPNPQFTPLMAILAELGYNIGDNLVQLPDLRGRFLRGVEKNIKVGELQKDAIKKHKHPIYGEAQTIGSTVSDNADNKYRVFMTEIRGRNMPSPRAIFEDSQNQGASSSDHGRFQGTGADETRPKNISIVWCIKY